MKKNNKRINKIKFEPKLKYYEIEYLVEHTTFKEKEIKNTQVYNLIKKLISKASPTYKDKFDKKWFYFYLPIKRSGCSITIPFSIMEYKKEFFVGFHQLGNLHIKKGKKKIEKEYKTIFKETLRFIPLIKKTKNEILKKTIPYDIRTGKIKGKYIMKKSMLKKEKEKILLFYEKHLKKQLKISQISLNKYLKVAAICYQAAYGKKTKNLSSLKMYKRWADGRDGGMLSIKNWNSKEEFMDWEKSGRWIGSHPFEIVFSGHNHGIHLYPPYEENPYYSLQVTNYAYARDFIKMVKSLIKKKVPFQARELKEVIEYLSGETYFTVNDYDEHVFYYIPSKEYKDLYFLHIEWDKIEVPKWKEKEKW